MEIYSLNVKNNIFLLKVLVSSLLEFFNELETTKLGKSSVNVNKAN
jgi:hypothetical protein